MDQNEEAYLAFESFDFENCLDFQNGWKSIVKRCQHPPTDSTLLNAKFFFYSKHIQPINLESYVSWKNSKGTEELANPILKAGADFSSKAEKDTCADSQQTKSKTADQYCADNLKISETVQIRANMLSRNPAKMDSNTDDTIAAYKDDQSLLQDCTELASKVSNISLSCHEKETEDLTSKSSLQNSSVTPCAESSSPTSKVDENRTLDKTLHTSWSKSGNDDESSVPALVSSNKSEKTSPIERPKCTFLESTGVSKHSTEEIQPTLSLTEIANLINSKQPIPGLVTFDVKPTNTLPTPSALTRRVKPWQLSVSSPPANS